MTSIACPGCARLVTALASDPGIAPCAVCQGVWMGNAVAHALVAGELFLVGFDVFRTRPGAPAKGYREAEVLTRSCPECGGTLSKVAAPADVELDVCREHGVYFDAGELEAVHRFYAQRAKDQRAIDHAEKRAFLKELYTTDGDA